MSHPPPFVLPPEGRGPRVRAVLAGAGRQRVAVALLALAALVGAGVVWARATPRLTGVPAGQEPVAPADRTLPRAAPDTPSATGPTDRVAVHVAGRVRRPGLVRLPAGSRVHDAIRAAGGVTSGADLDAVNLARRLTDGEQVRIPGPGDPAPPLPPGAAAPTPGVTPSAPWTSTPPPSSNSTPSPASARSPRATSSPTARPTPSPPSTSSSRSPASANAASTSSRTW
jgi:DNA uptake protein ComE-like DNA-binding protein